MEVRKSLPNDFQKHADLLPRHPKDIPVIVFKFNGKDNKPQEVKVRRKNVEDALMWLTGTNENGEPNNILSKDITIDYDLLEIYPVNGYLPETKSVEFDSDELDFDSDVNKLPNLGPMNSDEKEVLSPQTHELTLGSDPLNEFNTKYPTSLCFPALFSDKIGDPKNSCLLRNISRSETESFAEKIKDLIKFGEKVDGKWVHRFASHPRFAYWI